MRHSRTTAAVFSALLLAGVPVAAQVPGLPVYNAGIPRGVGIFADLGFPNDDAGGGTAYGLTGRVGLGVLAFTASAIARTATTLTTTPKARRIVAGEIARGPRLTGVGGTTAEAS